MSNVSNVFFKLINVCLVLLIFSVNFEYWDPFGMVDFFSISKMAAILYIICWLPLMSKISMKPLKYFLIPLFIYLLIEFFSSAINNSYSTGITSAFNLKILQMVYLLILITNHIRLVPSALNWVLKFFVLSVFVMGVLSYMDLGQTIDTIDENRLLLFGENPNMTGMKASFALLIIFNFLIQPKSFFNKVLSLLILVPILLMLKDTASRGALFSVFLGLGLMIIFNKISNFKKILLAIAGLFFSAWLFNFIMDSSIKFQTKMNVFLDEGDTGRNQIWKIAFQIIEDNILIGVGKSGVLPSMREYYGTAVDPHNVFIFVLMSSGVIGFLFFMLFIYRIGKMLYIKFKVDNNILFGLLFITLLFNMSKAGGFIEKTFLWFMFAILISSIIKMPKTKNKKRENFSSN